MFHISVVNRTRTVADLDLHRVVRAINRQIAQDFEPYWAFGGRLRVEGPSAGKLDPEALREMRGDAVLYLLDSATQSDALGYHTNNMGGIPFGFVYLDLCAQLGDPWSATLSHEALELIADPMCNLLVQGPNPQDAKLGQVFHYFEMCDAVQAQVYEIDAVPVSNFVLPAYFTENESPGTRKDFSGTALQSFGANPGGYIGYYDPASQADDTYFPDRRSEERYRIKTSAALPMETRPLGRVARRRGSTRGSASAQQVASRRLMSQMTQTSSADVALVPRPDPIRHVVVLMMENRSFDHMLGGLNNKIPGLDGVDPAHPGTNVDPVTGKPISQEPIATKFVSRDFEVPHEFEDVTYQVSEGMKNFVSSFVKRNPRAGPDERKQVMAYFKDGELPVLHALAKNFKVCTRWFSSLPGPTWPNRLFVHSGTSLGHVLMPDAENAAQIAQLWGTYDQKTLYDRLDDAMDNGKPLSWRIYHDGFPQSVILDHLKGPFLGDRYASMESFYEDAKFESTFPHYAFVEPRYSSSLFRKENDQHCPSGVAEGEQLIANIYDAIRGNDQLWNSTLLIVTYDEHGGFYDHVVPPAAVPPDSCPCDVPNTDFAFERLGVRVPAILISPYVDAGCDDSLYDHTSILRYMLEKYGLAPLGERTTPSNDARRTGNFASQLRGSPRDASETLPPFSSSGKRLSAAVRLKDASGTDIPPDNGRRALLAFAEKMVFMDEVKRRPFTRQMAQAAVAASSPTPKETPPFTARVTEVDAWLSERARKRTPMLETLAEGPSQAVTDRQPRPIAKVALRQSRKNAIGRRNSRDAKKSARPRSK